MALFAMALVMMGGEGLASDKEVISGESAGVAQHKAPKMIFGAMIGLFKCQSPE